MNSGGKKSRRVERRVGKELLTIGALELEDITLMMASYRLKRGNRPKISEARRENKVGHPHLASHPNRNANPSRLSSQHHE